MRTISLKSLLFLLVLIPATRTSLFKVEAARVAIPQHIADSQEVLYLPSGKALNFLSLGYRNTLADLLWFNTINYFGKHYQTDRNYSWFGHMCDLVTDLDPKAPAVHEFCSAMLSWESSQPELAIKILTKAINNKPADYFYYYLRGFTYMHFLNDNQKAHLDFVQAAKFPDANLTVKRLAASTATLYGDPETAMALLSDLVSRATEPNQKKALEDRLKEARYELDCRALEKAIAIYKDKFGSLPKDIEALSSSGIVSKLPLDPFGGKYYFVSPTAEIKSTSNRQRLKLYKRPVVKE